MKYRYEQKGFCRVDGCGAGWFAVFLIAENEKNCEWKIKLFPIFSFLLDFLKKEYEQVDFLILIDIHIVLKSRDNGRRLSDLGTHRILKARKSSIFPAPCRQKYLEAGLEYRPQNPRCGQLPYENEIFRENVKEVAPEISFQKLAGHPMEFSKRSHNGFIERIKAPKTVCQISDEIVEAVISKYRRKEVAKDEFSMPLPLQSLQKWGANMGLSMCPGSLRPTVKG